MESSVMKLIRLAEERYDAKLKNQNTLGNSANLIYEMETAQEPIILRISEDSEGKRAHMDLELNWLSALSGEVPETIKPVPTRNGTLFDRAEIGGRAFLFCAMEKAEGGHPQGEPRDWDDAFITAFGAVMGKLHAHSKKYIVREEVQKRFAWDRDLPFGKEYDDKETQPIWERIVADLGQVPRSRETYGIIHNDLHHLNLFVKEGRFKVFDFDDCIFGWYLQDMATTLFQVVCAVGYHDRERREQFAARFIKLFIQGYRTQTEIDPEQLRYLDLFLKFRRIYSYRFILSLFKDTPENPHKDYIAWMKKEILGDTPFVSVSWQDLPLR